MHLVHQNFKLELRNLDTHKKQSRGFMYHETIPEHFGLFFPNCGNSPFHMATVGAPLLLIGIDDKNIIQALEVREPESDAKRMVSKAPMKHILEIHPKYSPYFKVGDKIKLEDRV